MFENSSRLGYSENAIAQILRDLADLRRRVAAVEQQPWSGGGGGGGAGQQATAGYFGCTLSANLPHGNSLAGQTVWQFTGGARSTVTTSGTVYNDGPNGVDDATSGGQAILAANPDGTYTLLGVWC